jgi:crotonobetainyl-CoA:carnitine CoA-transferase CaiB-like acyl-CoA transferase
MSDTGPAALHGLRVVELTGERGAYCGKLFADLGADVIKVEPPGGCPTRWIPPFRGDRPDPERGLFFLYMNTSKRSVELDLEQASGREAFRDLVAGADLLLETCAPGRLGQLGLDYADLCQINPRLVLTSITGFGQSGPHRELRSSDIVAGALGGAMAVIGHPEDPPVRLAGAQFHVIASCWAAAASAIALHHAAETGRGQHVDISAQETAIAASHICGVGKWLEDGIIPKRLGTGLVASVPSGAYPCRDGLVYLMVNRPAHWKALAEWISEVTGNREVLDPMFDGPSSNRLPYRELLDLFISELTSRLSVDEVYHEGQRRHIAFTPANTAASLARDGHLAARGYFVEVAGCDGAPLRYPGAPYRHAVTPWRLSRPAPRVGEHSAEVLGQRAPRAAAPAAAAAAPSRAGGLGAPSPPPQALAGLRVVEFGTGMAGPWVGRLMAWCGAEVIKVESRKHPDVPRLYVPPRQPELGVQPQLSPWFTDWNAGKRFVALDLSRPDAVELCRQLIARSDVVVENYSTGTLAKLGLGYPELRARNPRLVMLSSSGYGDAGPYAHYVTWGPNIEALAGLSTLSGFPERDCTMTHFAYPDPLSALHGLFAVMAALRHRRHSGRGQHISLSQLEVVVAAIGHVVLEYLSEGREPPRLGNRSRYQAPHGCYRCRGDDRWCAIAVSSEPEWQALCNALGQRAWLSDPRFATLEARLVHAQELDALIEQWTREREDYEVMRVAQAAGVPAGVVQTTEDQLRRDPHLAARGYFEQIPHYKKGTVTACGIPLGLRGTPGFTAHAGEAIGQDNEYVFGALLGLAPGELRRLIAEGAIEPAG